MKLDKKEKRITVRITPHLDFVLDLISKESSIKKAAIIRFALDKLLESYEL